MENHISNKDNRKESQQSFISENIANQQNKKRGSNGSNIQNTSLNVSINNESQSQSSFQNNQQIPKNQNVNPFSMNPFSNFPAKEFFNFSFFKRQMSSRSSDVDIYQENKEGVNEFFNTKCKSIISRDSEKQINSKKSSELNSFEYMLPNLENKEENNQIFLTRANSARTKNYRNSNNYIPKAVFFQRNNSNNPSCFYKKHHIEKQNNKNGGDNNNLVLKYYNNNNEFNNYNKNILEMVNDKDDESEENEENSEEDDEKDDSFLIKKDKDNFMVNYITGKKEINLPKSTFSLFHRGSNNINKEKEKDDKEDEKKKENKEKQEKEKFENKEKEKIEDNKEDINIIFGDFIEKEIIEEEKNNNEDNISEKEKNEENNNCEIKVEPLPNNENIFDINKINDKDKNKIINQNILNNNMKNDEIINNNIKNQYLLNKDDKKNIIDKDIKQNYNNNQENVYNKSILQFPNIYQMNFNGKKINQNLNDNKNFIYFNKINNVAPSIPINNNDEFLKNVSSYIKDQQGCRYIQKKIEENPDISNKLFDILYNDIISMSKDLFGNYAIQKILENIEPNNLIKFIELISKDFYNLAISIYGTRVVQKTLEIVSKINYIKNKEIYEQCFKELNKYITENIVALSSNNNSSHIIIKYVNEVKYPQNEELYSEVYINFIPLCKNKHGCCVIQKCIELGNIDQKNKLLELSKINCDDLISDQFGNYVIQYVLNLNVKSINSKVFEILKNNLIPLCKEKYASNVIEKFLINKSPESLEIINILLKNENYLHELIKDQYGNYIIQRILQLVERENRSNLINYIVKWYPEIKTLTFGPRLISKLHERFQEFTLLVTQKYGWETTQEISYLYNKLNLKNNLMSNNNNNKTINGMYYFPNIGFINNSGNQMIGTNNNNNFLNFKNKNNVGNINFIQMNNYMLANGQNNLRFPMNGLEGINYLNNINNGQFFENFGNNINNNINYNMNQNFNNNIIQKTNFFGVNNNNLNNNFMNYNPNIMNYNQYLNATFSNLQNK